MPGFIRSYYVGLLLSNIFEMVSAARNMKPNPQDGSLNLLEASLCSVELRVLGAYRTRIT